ncbi:hypothetical protein DPMN_112464 [Dreissena polymorpha]|uniref:Uncharacterized protein n=1 Tax=Dreissena polymorpha TaxID=45954 RepID=A0A9D4KGE6_DREPO|nr:hypothetical protein DPMN_112464 [Dreissena polymorpha]
MGGRTRYWDHPMGRRLEFAVFIFFNIIRGNFINQQPRSNPKIHDYGHHWMTHHLFSNTTYIKAKFPLSTLTDACLLSPLVRRMKALPKVIYIPSGCWELGNLSHHISISSLLGLQSNQTQSVVVFHLPTFTSRKSPDLAATSSLHLSPALPTQAFVAVYLSSTDPVPVSALSVIPDATTSPTMYGVSSKSTSDLVTARTSKSTPVR